MFLDQFVRKSGVADEQHASRGDQRTSSRHLLWRYRVCILLVLTLFGLHLLAAGSGVGKGVTLSAQLASPGYARVQMSLDGKSDAPPSVGMGAGASSERMGVTAQAAVCLNPLDVTCWLQNAAQWVAQQITSALQPVINAIHGAAHFSLYFLGLFIDLENALCSVATTLAGSSMPTNLIAGIFQGNLPGEGLLAWVLAFVLGVMAILLGAQMVVRLALLWVLLVLSGPGLACFALPQTMGFGRMWLSLTASTVMVQFFQVVALALGGTLLTSLGASNLFGVGGTVATLLVCVALLYLVLRIPGIVHRFALRPMMDASRAAAGAAGGAAGFVADVAPRLLALL
jgi:hypothetical protein